MPFCNCQEYCRGGKAISIRAYQRHKPFRNQIDQFSVEFAAFVAAAKRTKENPVPHNDNDLDIGGLFDRFEENGLEGVNEEVASTVPEDEINENPSIHSDNGNNQIAHNHTSSVQGEDPNIHLENNQVPGSLHPTSGTFCTLDQNFGGNHDGDLDMDISDAAADPGSLAMEEMNVDEPQTANDSAPGFNLNIDELAESASLGNIKTALDFIQELKNASLDDGHLTPDICERLRDPPSGPVHLTPDDQLSLELFLSVQNSAQQVYISVKKAIEHRSPEYNILTYDQAKQLTAEVSGISPITDHMCIKSCIAYTGPFSALEICTVCSEPRFDSHGQPRQLFNTIPIGPQLQALKRDPDNAAALRYRTIHTQATLSEIAANNGVLKSYSDFFDGTQYLEAVEEGLIRDDDFVIMLSLDGAQLYASKQSDCWICIWVVLDHSPDVRYRKAHVLPAFVIPGPNAPRVMDSFVYRSLQHLAALQKDGLRVWDASTEMVVTSYPFFALGTADGPGLTHLNGLVGHMGKSGCRMYCNVTGRRKPRDSHYYPALLKPLPPYNVEGCDQPDPNFDDPGLFMPSVERYRRRLSCLVHSRNETNYKANRLETGIVKPSIFLGLNEKHCLPVPLCFGSDIMHHASLNIPDLLIPLWRGTLDCSTTDKRTNWDWAVLTGDTWTQHGIAVAAATPYLPGSFDRPPRNPALKISSGYKAWEFLMYLYGLGPGVFYNILPTPYYENFCDLVYGIRIINQHTISSKQLVQAEEALYRFAQGFENLYYQRRVDRIHFVRQSIHQCYHLAMEVTRVGPPIISSQWTMERTIGNLTRELRQPSNPYANLVQRALLRCQISALKKIIPNLDDSEGPPRGSIILGDEYMLLRRRDTAARPVLPSEELALMSYFQELPDFRGTYFPLPFHAVRWARLRLPSGQIARSLWIEQQKAINRVRMARNVKIIQGPNAAVEIAEVRFYCRISLNTQEFTLAFVSPYSSPHQGLLKASQGTLWSSTRVESVKVIDVKHITAVVAMVPHKPFEGEERFFLVEKPGLDAAYIGGQDEQTMDID